jgi:hypothetical protein
MTLSAVRSGLALIEAVGKLRSAEPLRIRIAGCTTTPAQPIVDSTMDSRAPVRLGAAVHESSMNPKIVEPARYCTSD